jgi:hypothetical protein
MCLDEAMERVDSVVTGEAEDIWPQVLEDGSVTAFNGAQYRQRPIADVVREFQSIREKHVLVVDDNLIGTRSDHIARAKDLFRAMIRADLRKESGAGCRGRVSGRLYRL